ncbi:TBC-domain-containing protein [Choiromyces venosus 120613-1]|uniref:TBC-domain-containing protein n=1 Tax=Choiromyces venosus 120613-1 TaxID=1336337 RepID=A0A3N4JAD3_9PEZI|nr:TBC-domain-containing protein [Choiromyces venosus 120613-1]
MELKSGPCEDGSPPASTSGTPSVDGSLESTPTDLQQSISSQASSTVDFFETADESHPLSNTGSDDDDHESLSLAASITNTTTKSISPVSQRSIFRPPSDRTSAPQSITSSAASPLHKSLASPITRPAEQSSDPRSALFDDHVASAHVPGSLHLAPDSAIEKLVERQGIIPLIRQLASDLAHRDKELVSIRRRAEERERALKKMLVEVEVSNADIEKRLAAATVQRKPSKETIRSAAGDTSYTESIDDMMQQAMSEEDVFSVVDDSLSMMEATTDLGDDDRHSTRDDMITPKATLRARSDSRSILFERDTDSMSIISNASSRRGSTIRGWKSFFWGQRIGEGDEKSVGNERLILQNPPPGKRRGITNETFSPPPEGKPRILSRASSPAVSMIQPGSSPDALVQRGTSNAVAAWAMRLVSHAPPLHDQENFNPKSPMQPRSASATEGLRLPTDRRASSGSIDRENLQRIMAKNAVRTQTSPRRRTASTASNGAPPKSSKFFQDIMDHAERIVPLGNTQNASSADPSSGPVEMDRIVPHAIQPPTLLQSWNDYYPTDYLTDRFGFIYDKKNKAPSAKSMSSVESGDAKKPQYEDAKSGSTPNEGESSNASNGADDALLDAGDTRTPTRWQELPSEMPSTSLHQSKTSKEAPAKAVDNSQYGQPAKSLIDRIAKSTSAVASPTTTTFSEAPLALRSPLHSEMPSIAEASTVRLLLGQLSDLHDSLQRDRGAKWNEFLKKIRQERRRGEEEEKGMPEVLMGDGELIGIATLGNEGRGGKQRWKEFKSLVLGGIPVAYRWKVWTECSGATAMRVPGYYEDILENGLDDPLVISQIEMDINRTLTDNVFYRQGPGVSKLKQVLVAYSRRNSAVGYCQGMNMIAASLLLIMPSEEDAFWVLCSIVEKILPKTYFETNLLASRADQQVLKQYVQEALPSLHMHLQKLGVELEALTFQWFLSIFTDCLAAEALFRIWDVILCLVGSPFLFQVALALLRLNEKALISCKSAAAVYSYLNGEMTHQGISIDGLIRESDGMKHHVKRKEVELRRERAVEKELGEMGAEDNGNAAAEAVKTDSPIHVVANSSDEESREPSTKSIHDEEREDSKDQDGTKGEAAGVAEAEPSSCVIQEETAEELLADDAEPVVKTIEPVTNEDQKPETMPSPPPDKLITSIPPTEASAIPIVATT